ncbi:hypothetical protein EC07798_1108, partial [Escherichia coli 07798]
MRTLSPVLSVATGF